MIGIMRTEQGTQSLRSFAGVIGVSPAYLSDIYKGKRRPGAKVLGYFGIGKTRRTIVQYLFFRKK